MALEDVLLCCCFGVLFAADLLVVPSLFCIMLFGDGGLCRLLLLLALSSFADDNDAGGRMSGSSTTRK